MAPPLTVLQSQECINANGDAVTSPAGPVVERTPPVITQKPQAKEAIARNSSNESTQIVKESVESIPENYAQRHHSAASTPVRPSAHKPPADDSDDLYDATPRASNRTQSPKQSTNAPGAERTQGVGDKLVASVETQRAEIATRSRTATAPGPNLSQLFTDEIDVPVARIAVKATPKPRLLTQTSKSDKIEPAPGTSTDPPASKTSRKNSNESSTHSAQSRNVSGTSQTSAMASTAKSVAAALEQTKSQLAATAKAKLEAMKAAKAGDSAPATLPASKAVPVKNEPPSVLHQPRAGFSKQAANRDEPEAASVAAVGASPNEPGARTGKLPTSRKSIPGAGASTSKDLPGDDVSRPERKAKADVHEDDGTATANDRKGKLKAISKQKQKAGAFLEDNEDTDLIGDGGEASRRVYVQPARKPVQQPRAAVKRKRKAGNDDNDDNEELCDVGDTAPTMIDKGKRRGALPSASMKNKRQKQAPTSSAPDEEQHEQHLDDDDESEYGVPKSPAKKASRTTKEAKTVGKSRTPQPTRTTRRQAAAKDKGKIVDSIPAAIKAEGPTTSRTHNNLTAQVGSAKHVSKQEQKQKEAVSTTVKPSEAHGDHTPVASGSKAQGKTLAYRAKDERNDVSAKPSPDSRLESNVLGQTQGEAIVLSDDEGKSSSLTESSTPEKMTVTAQHAHAAPMTPAPPMCSSPPVPDREDSKQLAQLQRTVRAHKPTFINFDKSGPRNQGIAAVKTPGTKSVKNISAAPPSPRAKLELKRKGGPSSFATSVRSGKPTQRASSSNIASTVDDALSNLLQKQNKLPLKISTDPDDAVTAHRFECSNVDLAEADDEFMNIDDYGDHDDRLVQTHSPPKPVAEETVVDPEVKPVLAKGPTTTASTKPPIELYQKPVQKHKVVVAERPENKPVSEQPASPKRPPQKPRKPAPAKAEAIIMGAQGGSIKPHEKRSLAGEHGGRPAAKRGKVDVEADETVHHPTASAKVRQLSPMPEVAASSTPQDERAKVMAPPVVPAKPSRPSTKAAALSAVDRKTKPARHAKVQLSRHIRHGSQTVDVHGSPVPAEMVVGNTNTVLETFSQQIGVVSDQDAVERTLKRQRTKFGEETQQPDNDLRYSVPQSRQPKPLSSNTKPLPAAPQAASNVVPRLELSQSQSEKLLDKRDSLAEMLDPFSGSNDVAAAEGFHHSVSIVSGLTEQLDEKMKRLEDNPASSEAGSENMVTHTEPRDSKGEPEKSPSSASDSRQDEAEMLDYDMEQLRAINSLKHHPHEEDPDKTLVNDYDEVDDEDDDNGDESQDYVKDALHEESGYKAEDLESSDPDSDDLMSWRKILKPHQLNLFQELIKTSHRLTEYFVEQENSVLRNVEKAHRQRIYAIEQEEIARAKLYTAKMEELKRKRKENKKDLKKAQKNLAERLEQKKKDKEVRRAKMAEWEEENEDLEALINKLS